MNSAAPPPSLQDDAVLAPGVHNGPGRRTWVADFVPVSESDPDLQAALRQLQWALDTENQN